MAIVTARRCQRWEAHDLFGCPTVRQKPSHLLLLILPSVAEAALKRQQIKQAQEQRMPAGRCRSMVIVNADR